MSELSYLKDRHGNDLVFGCADGVWMAPSPGLTDFRGQLKNVRQLELKDDDVILATFPRSGTFWHHQIITMLMNESTEYMGQVDEDHVDWCPFEKLVLHDKPRIYSTHLRFRFLPKQLTEKKVKVVYAYRNPKDSWVSFYNVIKGTKLFPTYEGTWAHFFDLMIDCGYYHGSWFDHVKDWEKTASEHPGLVLFSCYELMKKDPVGQIMKINQFLGLNRSRELCEQIAEACQFSNMKAAKEPQKPQLHGDDAWKEGASRWYRKGEIGDWKNWFTVAQSEQLDAVFKKRMAGSTLPFYFE